MPFLTRDELDDAVQQVLPEIVEFRRELHRHPEIRFEEQWTSDRIARFLGEAGVHVKRGYANGTGIVGTIPGKTQKAVAFRSDIDALELQEDTGLAYASETPDRMHACGHDGHMAMLCGAAKILAQHAVQLERTVKLIFQPAEELGAGGRLMVDEGVLEGVEAVFGMHGWPSIPVGTVGLKIGYAMAGADWFRILIHGKGCHSADPSAGVDPILVGAHIVTGLQSIVSRELDPREPAVVSVGRIHAGVARNIIPETAEIEGTFRTFSAGARDKVSGAIARIATSTAETFRATAEIEFGKDSYVPLYNDPAMSARAREIINESLGDGTVLDIEQPSMAAEDFAFYLRKVPGTFFWLGTQRIEGTPHSLHSPHFDFNDSAIPTGIGVWLSLANL